MVAASRQTGVAEGGIVSRLLMTAYLASSSSRTFRSIAYALYEVKCFFFLSRGSVSLVSEPGG